MPRPNYSQEQLRELTRNYQAAAYRYAGAIMDELERLDEDEELDRNSAEYRNRKAELNSCLYLTVQNAMDAQAHIEQGYPRQFSSKSIEAMSDRLMKDPAYAEAMQTQPVELPLNRMERRNAQHAFRDQIDQQLGDRFQPQTIDQDVLPQQDRARRAVVLRQVLKELDATKNGYYVPGIRRGSNSREFENVKSEVRRQIAMLEGNMPLSKADDDRMLRTLDAYSQGKRSNRTRGFGNTRQKNVLKLYAEYTQHPAPRPANDQPLHTAREIETLYNEEKGLNDDRYVNHDDYVSFARPEYTEVPGRTVEQEFNDSVRVLRDLTKMRRISGQPLTASQQATYREHVLRATALQNIMVTDPAGPNARLDADEINAIVQNASEAPFVNGALAAANRSWEHMNELTTAIQRGYRPQMSRNYRANPDAYRNPMLRNFQTISYPTIAEQLHSAKEELRNQGLEGGPLTQTQTSRLRPIAIKVMALQKLAYESEHGGTEHLSPDALNEAIQNAPDESEIQRAVDTALTDPAKAQELSEALSVDIEYEALQQNLRKIARGGIENMVDAEETRISELLNHTYSEQEQQEAENGFIRFAALNNVRDAHRDDEERNPYVTDEEINEAEQALRADNVFMGSVRGKIQNTQDLQKASSGLASLRYEKHRQLAESYLQQMHDDTDSADAIKPLLAHELACMTAVRNLQRRAGSDNAVITDQDMRAETNTVKLGDAHLALVRGLEQDGEALGRQLMENTFSKSGDEFTQAHAQHVVPLRRTYPYPEFRPGSIGAAYEALQPYFNPQDSNETLARNTEGRQQLAEHTIRAMALRQMTLESPEGAHARLSEQRLHQIEDQIRNNPVYADAIAEIKASAPAASQAMRSVKNAPDLNALKARYNRAQGGEFIDPLVGTFSHLTAAQWAEREKQTLTNAQGQNRQWSAQDKQRLIRSYARMHAMREHDVRHPGRAEEMLRLTLVNNAANEYLERPGVKEKMDALFADPSTAMEHTIANQKRNVWLDLNLSDADRVAKLMALSSLQNQAFPDALITPAELAAEEAKIRSSVSYQQINDYLLAGGSLADIEPTADENYFDVMEERSVRLPGVQPGYANHKKVLTGQLRAMQQQGRTEDMDQALAELFLVTQYEKDGIPYEQIPPRGKLGPSAGKLARTDDFQNAMNILKKSPEELNNLLDGVDNGLSGADLAQMIDGLAAQDRLQNAPDDLRNPDILHEVHAQVMADQYADLLAGNAEEKWASEAQKLARRDDYLRFTAMNRLYAEHPEKTFLSEAEINQGVEALKNDQKFMAGLNARLESPLQLRQAVFNSGGIQRWSDTEKLAEYRNQLQNAKKMEAEGRGEAAGFAYGMVANQLAGAIDARLSGREMSNAYLSARDLSLSVNQVQFSERYRAIENAIQADVKEFDRIQNLFKLPPSEFKAAYEQLTDEFMEKYPSVPMKDTHTIGNNYNQALAGIQAAAQEDPAAIANDEVKRQELAKNIREMFLDRRVIVTAPQDPQLMKREVTVYDNPNSGVVAGLREQATEGVDSMLGDLNERLKDPQVVAGYVNALKDAGDLRVLAAEEYHSKEVFTDPLVTKIREAGLAIPPVDPNLAVRNAAAQVRNAPAGETPEQREQRLQGQIAGVLNKALLKVIPADELPNTQQQAEQEQFIQTVPGFKDAVKKMANDPQALESFLNAAEGGASGADLAKLLDQNAIAQGKEAKPGSDPASNILFYLRKNTMQGPRDGLYKNTTGKGMTSWMRGQKDVALDHCVRATAVNKLLHTNPDRVYFTNAEIQAQYKKVLEDKEYTDMLEDNARNGQHLRGEFFGYQGVMTWDQMTSAINFADMSIKTPAMANSFMPGAWFTIAEIIPWKRNGAVTNNRNASTQEKTDAIKDYEQSEEYQMLKETFTRNPELLKHYVLDVFNSPDNEFDAKHKAFVDHVRELNLGGANVQQNQQQAQPEPQPEQPAPEEDDLEIDINGQKFDIKGEGEGAHLEEQAKPEDQAQPEPEPEAREAVGWPQFGWDNTPLKIEGDLDSPFNKTRESLDQTLKQPVVEPSEVENSLGTLYISALLQKAGKPVTPEAIEACRPHLAEDKTYQKYVTKCLSDRKFAQEQLNTTLTLPDADKMREGMKAANAQPVQIVQPQPGTPMAQFKENLQKLNDSLQLRNNAQMEKNDINRFAMQTCKTVALYNLSQSPKYQGKQVDYEDMKAEALRLKDDPAMKKTIWAAVNDPAAYKALIEGMERTQKDPQHFTNYVQGFGDAPKEAKEWLDATYRQVKPAVQEAQNAIHEEEKKKDGPQAGPAPH
ncbi:MAG: hypothetical protein IKW92_09775 [Firmicutes bacterium]|nr:hypothetical protein [Bacillota bacterium]